MQTKESSQISIGNDINLDRDSVRTLDIEQEPVEEVEPGVNRDEAQEQEAPEEPEDNRKKNRRRTEEEEGT